MSINVIIGLLVYFLSVLHLSKQKSTVSSPFYVAAVVEYAPYVDEHGIVSKIVAKNVANYEKHIREAAAKEADIIVFPPYGLISFNISRKLIFSPDFASQLPDAKDLVNPCVDDHTNVSEAVRNLSCLARAYRMYVVASIPEVVLCNQNTSMICPRRGFFSYVTTIVFDRLGTLVARYRKYNLGPEPEVSTPSVLEPSVIDTDFGVKFGLLSTMDILHANPAQILMKDCHITNFIYTHDWVSELPFLTALQIQSAWARAHNVTMLASGYSDPKTGRTGSGIHYAGGLTKTGIMASKATSLTLIENVPKFDHRRLFDTPGICTVKNQGKITLYSDHCNFNSVSQYEGGLVALKDATKAYNTRNLHKYLEYNKNVGVTMRNITICHNSLCCQFDIAMYTTTIAPSSKHLEMKPNGYYYRLAVFDGLKTLSATSTIGIQVCAVIACTDGCSSSCGTQLERITPLTMSTHFEVINIRGNFSLTAKHMPNTLDQNLNPLPLQSFKFKKDPNPKNKVMNVAMSTNRGNLGNYTLLTFGIYSREYARDGLLSLPRARE